VTTTAPLRKSRRAYRKSGFHGTSTALSRSGLSALDGRSALARSVRDWKAAVAEDLGGEAVLSQAQRTLLEAAAVDVVLLNVADTWLRENASSVVNKRKRAFVPLVEQRLRVATHLAGLLETLGLKRVVRDVPRLSEYLASRAGTSTPEPNDPEAAA
jgi:hypothetical protein